MSLLDASGFPIVGPGTPYINPAILVEAPTGISWATLPAPKASPAQQLAAQQNICVRATGMVEEFCNQPLRATIDIEELQGPGTFRVQNQTNTGITRLLMSRGPVTAIIGGQYSAAAAFPPQWQAIAANQFRPEVTMLGIYGTTAPGASAGGGQAILLAPGWASWAFGRQNALIQVTYQTGWPHGSLTESAAEGDSSVSVDDITGWLGAVGTMYGGAQQETVLATAVTPTVAGAISGPGVLTLPVPLSFAHQAGEIVTTLPAAVMQATILFATVQALTRGATSTAVQSLSGGVNSGGGLSPTALTDAAKDLIRPFKRRI